MTVMYNGKKYSVPRYQAVCDTCDNLEVEGSHSDRWTCCTLMEDCNGYLRKDHGLCPYATLVHDYITEGRQQRYKAVYVDTPEGRMLKVTEVK